MWSNKLDVLRCVTVCLHCHFYFLFAECALVSMSMFIALSVVKTTDVAVTNMHQRHFLSFLLFFCQKGQHFLFNVTLVFCLTVRNDERAERQKFSDVPKTTKGFVDYLKLMVFLPSGRPQEHCQFQISLELMVFSLTDIAQFEAVKP